MTDNNYSAQAQISLIQHVYPGNTSATPVLVICKYISPSEKFVLWAADTDTKMTFWWWRLQSENIAVSVN